MLPRTARSRLLARRQFHHSGTQLAAIKSSKTSKPASTAFKSTPDQNGQPVDHAAKPQWRQTGDKTGDSAEKIARDALMSFIRSSLHVQAAQARHYGTFSTMREGMLLSENDQERNKAADGKEKKPVNPETEEERRRQKERIDEATRKSSATDQAREEHKEEKEVF